MQRALDSLANDGTMAAVISRYDLTMDALEPEILEVMENIVPYLRGHALWLLGEPGVGKTPLGRIIAMMFSRYHGMAALVHSDPLVILTSSEESSSTRHVLHYMTMGKLVVRSSK